MASICNDERAPFGVMSGHERKTLSLSDGSAKVAIADVTQSNGVIHVVDKVLLPK